MSWTRKLPKPIQITDGRTVFTLAHVRDVWLGLSPRHQANPHWRDLGELLMKAAYRGRQASMADVGAQFALALAADGIGLTASLLGEVRPRHGP